MDKILITSALEKTWFKEKNLKRVFLTEACLIYTERKKWKNFDKIILDYHWDDRVKMKNDFEYLNSLYEQVLFYLTSELNSYHSTKKNIN